jgi:hypothetical protein
MRRRKFSAAVKLERLRRKFERWRETRKGRPPIPEPLWKAAVDLVGDYSINKVARTLRLNNEDLKKRAEATSGTRGKRKIPKPSFVELNLSQPAIPPECVVELEHPSGSRMKISIRSLESLDIAALSEAFWSQDS